MDTSIHDRAVCPKCVSKEIEGQRSAIEIAQTMGDFGVLPLMLIAVNLIDKGDCVRVREMLSCIADDGIRTFIMNMMDERQSKDRNRLDLNQPD